MSACALAALACFTVPARAAEKLPIYTLTCEKIGVPLEITLNGVSMHRAEEQDSSAVTNPINSWLRAGKNTLRIRTLGAATPDASIHCKVLRNALGEVVSTGGDSAGKPLVAFDWPSSKSAKGPLDKTLELTFSAKDAPSCELWKRAEKLTLDGPTREAILKQVQDLEAALKAGDARRVLELERFVGEDGCRCYGDPVEEFRRDGPERFRQIVSGLDKGKFEPWDPASAKVELVADGQLAEVTVNGGPPIVIVIEQSAKSRSKRTFKPYVAKIDGAFTIVRMR
jgi:hypothetical protein